MILWQCMNEEQLDLLREAYEAGCDKRQACIYARVSIRDLSKYELENPAFVQEMMDLVAAKEAYARVAVLKKVKRASKNEVEDVRTDAEFAFRLLERTSDEFKPKSNQDITSAGKPLPSSINIIAPKGMESPIDDANLK